MLGNGNRVVVELSEALARVVPVDDPHFLYASDGASAVEQALKIAFQYWHNRGAPGTSGATPWSDSFGTAPAASAGSQRFTESSRGSDDAGSSETCSDAAPTRSRGRSEHSHAASWSAAPRAAGGARYWRPSGQGRSLQSAFALLPDRFPANPDLIRGLAR